MRIFIDRSARRRIRRRRQIFTHAELGITPPGFDILHEDNDPGLAGPEIRGLLATRSADFSMDEDVSE